MEDSSAIWHRVSSALSCASSLTAIISVGPPAHALDALQAALLLQDMQDLRMSNWTHNLHIQETDSKLHTPQK